MKECHKEITIKRDSEMIIYINLIQRKYESFIHIFKTENVLTFFYHKCVSVFVGVCRLTTAVKIEFRCRFNVKMRDEPSNFYTDNYDTKKCDILREQNIHSRKTCRSKHILNEVHNEFVMRFIQSDIIRLSDGMFRDSRLVDLKKI